MPQQTPPSTASWPLGGLRCSYRHGDGRRTASARIARDGFVWLDAWEGLHLLQVRDSAGVQRWRPE